VTEPLLGRPGWAQLVAFDDSGDLASGFELISRSPGPAGSVTLCLGAVSVDFDPARDGRVNHVAVETWDEQSRRTLLRLIGTDTLRFDGDHVRFVRTGPDPRTGADEPDAAVTTRDGMRLDLSRLALTLDRAGSPGLFADERAALWLQAGLFAHRAGVDDLVPHLAPTLAAAIRRLAVRRDDQPLRLAATAAHVLAGVCTDALGLFPERAAELRAIRTRARSAAGARSRDDGRTPEDHRVPDLVSPDSLPLLLDHSLIEVRTGSGDECVVVLHGWGRRARGWWVRAFRASDRLLVALAPVLVEDGVAVGTLLISPACWSDLVIDIVDDAGTPTSPMRIAHVRAAVAAGQQAARAGRLGDAAEEDLAWRRCAAHHEAAGDEARALAARASASGASLASQPRGRPSRRGTPKGRAGAVSLVGDHIRPTASS
jgi:hypothetical protein